MRARYRADSFIKNTALVDNRYLDVNRLPTPTNNVLDEPYIIESEFDQRPDLLAHAVYKNSYLWWIFALRNPDILVDPIRDFTTGTEIIIPSESSIQALGDNVTGVS